MLFYINGYSLADVARISGTSVTAVKSRLHEARNRLKDEMMVAMERVLKSQAPDDEFARLVFEIITGPLGWHDRASALQCAGPEGIIAGFRMAAKSPSWWHRRNAYQMQDKLHRTDNVEEFVAALKEGLKDPNKKVRRCATEGLMKAPVDEARRRSEFAPLVAAMLDDRSRIIRRMAALLLLRYPQAAPLDKAFRAFASEPSKTNVWPLRALMEKLAGIKT